MKYDLELIIDEKNALSIILKQIHPNSVVLEFGPANGRMTRYLNEVLGCSVYIVEIDKEAVQDAIKYAEDALIDDIENYKWLEKWGEVAFDYVIFADVLEHLHNPQEVLGRTKKILKDDGKAIISVPNIGHNSVMINLYNNIFNYTPLGLLDNTHIHFFAYNTLKTFCHFAGYFPIVEEAVYSDVGTNEISNSFDDVSRDVAYNLGVRDYGNVYQFVFVLQKEEYTKINSCVTDYRIRKHMPVGKVKVYLDRGSGFCEDNCVTHQMYINKKFAEKILLENCEEIRAIRIDPLNISGIFKVNKIEIEDQEQTRAWELIDCDCQGEHYGEYLFGGDDSQIIFGISHLNPPAKLYIDIEYMWIYPDENALKVCIDVINKYVKSTDQIEAVNKELKRQECKLENDIKLLREELGRRETELSNRMEEINLRDKEIDKQRNKIKLLNEELDRRAVELDHRMDEINLRDREIDEKICEVKLLNEELDRRAVELDHRMDEINLRDREIDRQCNDLKLLNEELDRCAVELDHRMDEINLRDREMDRQCNDAKLLTEELDRRAIELDHRMDKINQQNSELLEMQEQNIRLKERVKKQEELINDFNNMSILKFLHYKNCQHDFN